jgi:chorismate synthase
LFSGIEGKLAQMLYGIPAIKGVEFGSGFHGSQMRGSENNDPFMIADHKVITKTNHAGGILGGITTGMPIFFRVAFKPTPSIAKPQESVNLRTMTPQVLQVQGRHDPCIVPRAVPVVEAAAAITIYDILLSGK